MAVEGHEAFPGRQGDPAAASVRVRSIRGRSAMFVIVVSIFFAPSGANALQDCSAKYRRKDGVFSVSAASVTGQLRLAFDEQSEPVAIPTERCTLLPDARYRCSLSDAGQLPPLSPPADCTARLFDDAGSCLAYISGCVPGERRVVSCLNVSDDGREVIYQGCNVHIRNSSGATATADGTGNLIMGWNEDTKLGHDRSGSHNLVVGGQHSWSSTGGIVAGYANTIAGESTAVLGGTQNVADGLRSAILGGQKNSATGEASSVSGGVFGEARGVHATVAGGNAGLASGRDSTVAGGDLGSAAGDCSFVGGGASNVASGSSSSVTGGSNNQAEGNVATVVGGISNLAVSGGSLVAGGESNTAGNFEATAPTVVGGIFNTALESGATVLGGYENIASASDSTVTGGHKNVAQGSASTVGGGDKRTASSDFDWVAGSLFEDD